MRLPWCVAIVCVSVLLLAAPASARQEPVTIGVVLDGPIGRGTDDQSAIRDEMVALLSVDFQVNIPLDKQIQADWTLPGIQTAIDQLLADPEVDLVLTFGVVGSHLASLMGDLPKPVIAPLVIDPDFQGLPRDEGGSGVANLNYIAVHDMADIRALREIIPFTRIGLLADARLIEAVPGADRRVQAGAGEVGLDVQMVPVGASVDAALAALDDDLEAVYVLPLLQLTDDQFGRLVQGLAERRLPSMSWVGEREVREGILTGRMTAGFITQLARRTALNTQRALLGDDLATMAVEYPASVRLTLNMRTAEAIGFSPTFMLLTEAELIDVEPQTTQELSLSGAVREAVDANLELRVRDRLLATRQQDVELAESVLRPRIDLDLDTRLIDEDRAASSFGTAPEWALSGSATLTQIVYADEVWANVTVERSRQQARRLDRDTLELDIAFEAALSYLNVLRARTVERIQREDLSLTRSNLELARLRVSVGTAAPGELLRWENQVAKNRRALVDASARASVVVIALNQLLGRPLDDPVATQEVGLDDPELASSEERLYRYLETPRDFRIFRRFLALEAVAAAPELRAIASLRTAQERVLLSAKRASWWPTFGLQGGVTNLFSEAGAGSDPLTFPALDQIALPQSGETDWFVGFNVTLPLFEGGAKAAERVRAREELNRLDAERDRTVQLVEQRLQASLHEMQASLLGIDLSRQAAEAARGNLVLVTDTYRRGAASILDLLDAQSAALVADQEAADAVYLFLIDLMRVQRAGSQFDFFTTPQATNELFDRLETYFNQAREILR
jgi:outer membrane protein TolC